VRDNGDELGLEAIDFAQGGQFFGGLAKLP
jgi:hypothetical protein